MGAEDRGHTDTREAAAAGPDDRRFPGDEHIAAVEAALKGELAEAEKSPKGREASSRSSRQRVQLPEVRTFSPFRQHDCLLQV